MFNAAITIICIMLLLMIAHKVSINIRTFLKKEKDIYKKSFKNKKP